MRERPAGIEGQRRQRGKNGFLEIRVGDGALLFGEIGIIQDVDSRARPAPGTSSLVQQSCALRNRRITEARMARICSAGVMPSGPVSSHALLDLPLQAGDPHHEELVDVGADERQEHQPLEQRIAVVLRLFQHAALKVDQAQLAIDVQRRDRRAEAAGAPFWLRGSEVAVAAGGDTFRLGWGQIWPECS